MSTPQEYWDACLIKTWRQDKKLHDAREMFKSIVGVEPWEVMPVLKRLPHKTMGWNMGVRYFVAHFLPKISDRLWDQKPERDVALLKAVSGSNYDTAGRAVMVDRGLASAQKEIHRTKAKRIYASTKAGNRNHDTDWNVVKASKRRTK